MRALRQRKTRLVFETEDTIFERGHSRQVIVEAHPAYAVVRLKGTRRGFPICYAAVYHAAVSQAVEEGRRIKAANRKSRRRRGSVVDVSDKTARKGG